MEPQLRKDPIVDRWVIIAPGRAARPNAFHAPVDSATDTIAATPCPFCEGHEQETPHEILALGRPCHTSTLGQAHDVSGWQVRVVPNKYPAVTQLSSLAGDSFATSVTMNVGAATAPGEPGHHDTDLPGTVSLGTVLPGVGEHELIIETPRHLSRTSQLSEPEFAQVVEAYALRLLALRSRSGLAYGLLFKNVGAAAGASLEHLHSQLLALPLVPTIIREELQGAASLFALHGQCAFCRLMNDEVRLGARIVAENSGFVAFTASAGRLPYETWIIPKRHASRFETIPAAERDELAVIWHDVLRRIELLSQHAAYNYWIHTAPFEHAAPSVTSAPSIQSGPFDSPVHHQYHWHVEIVPRLAMTAGFEWGSGCYVNPVSPEAAAAKLRSL